jgi:poly(3-hydroxybutyrate) depolymerase
VTNNQTNTTPQLSTYNNIERALYAEGSNGTSVDFYKILNGEHEWFNLNVENQDTANLLWNFFDLYDRNGLR